MAKANSGRPGAKGGNPLRTDDAAGNGDDAAGNGDAANKKISFENNGGNARVSTTTPDETQSSLFGGLFSKKQEPQKAASPDQIVLSERKPGPVSVNDLATIAKRQDASERKLESIESLLLDISRKLAAQGTRMDDSPGKEL